MPCRKAQAFANGHDGLLEFAQRRRYVERAVLHPDTELRFINDTIGYGVVATRPIPQGTVTWVRDRFDQQFTAAEVAAMPSPYRAVVDKYTFVDRHGLYVLCWDLARFLNHSCRATCLAAGYDFEVAVRDIAPGEELTDDYGTLNLDVPFHCECGAPDCRKTIYPNDLMRFGDAWDALLAEPFARLGAVEQPLEALLATTADWPRVVAVRASVEKVASCRDNFRALEAEAPEARSRT